MNDITRRTKISLEMMIVIGTFLFSCGIIYTKVETFNKDVESFNTSIESFNQRMLNMETAMVTLQNDFSTYIKPKLAKNDYFQ